MLMREEKRREERIPLKVPVQMNDSTGISRDISSSGIYFLTEQLLPPGDAVNFSVKLDFAYPHRQCLLTCRGEVLRVETTGHHFGVAASINECWCTFTESGQPLHS